MSQSSAFTARQAVKALLATALPNSRVTWGGPSESEDVKDDMVYLGGVTRNVELRGFGAPAATSGMFGEEYRFPVIAIGRRERDDEEAAEEYAWAIVDAIETAIRSDLGLGGVLNQHAEFGTQEVTTEPVNNGWLYRASVELVCNSVI